MRTFYANALWLAAVALLVVISASAGTIQGRVQTANPNTDLSTFVVYVEDVEGPFPPPREPAVMDQKSLRFVPHVLPILAGTTVEFPNSDPLAHNVFSISDTKRFNLGLYGRGTVRRLRFERPGVVALLCNVHLEMSAYIVVLKNPYFARTAADGTYRIDGVPAGRHRLRCWHEQLPEQSRAMEVPASGSLTEDFRME